MTFVKWAVSNCCRTIIQIGVVLTYINPICRGDCLCPYLFLFFKIINKYKEKSVINPWGAEG